MNERNEGQEGPVLGGGRKRKGLAGPGMQGRRRRPDDEGLEVTERTWVFPPLGYETPCFLSRRVRRSETRVKIILASVGTGRTDPFPSSLVA